MGTRTSRCQTAHKALPSRRLGEAWYFWLPGPSEIYCVQNVLHANHPWTPGQLSPNTARFSIVMSQYWHLGAMSQ